MAGSELLQMVDEDARGRVGQPPCQPRTDTQFGSSLIRSGGLIRTSAVTMRLSAEPGASVSVIVAVVFCRYLVAQSVGGGPADDQNGQRDQADADARGPVAVDR